MPEVLVADYAWNGPSLDALSEAGYRGIARYFSWDTKGKNLTDAERRAAHAKGLSVAAVWETTAARTLGGANAGRIDAWGKGACNDQADALGWPDDACVYYAVDFDAQPHDLPTIAAYLDACKGRRPVGVYGSYRVVEAMLDGGHANYGWQTAAWSGGKVSQKAHLYQRLAKTLHPLAGDYDENVVLKPDYGAWMPSVPNPDPRRLVVVPNYWKSLPAPNGGVWHFGTDGGVFAAAINDGPVAPFYGSVPGVGGLPAGVTLVDVIAAAHGGYTFIAHHDDTGALTPYDFPPA